jgi:hypothetical protein
VFVYAMPEETRFHRIREAWLGTHTLLFRRIGMSTAHFLLDSENLPESVVSQHLAHAINHRSMILIDWLFFFANISSYDDLNAFWRNQCSRIQDVIPGNARPIGFPVDS